METLAKQSCEACRKGAPKATAEEIKRYMKDLPNWTLAADDGPERLRRQFAFKNFAEALRFTNAVGQIAEDQNHHPTLVTEWGKVTVEWYTHKIGGLHKNDFVMAARTDEANTSVEA